MTLADQAIEHFGISTNLLEFLPIPSRCGSSAESSPSPNGTDPTDSLPTYEEVAKEQDATYSFEDNYEIDMASPATGHKSSTTGPNANFWSRRNSSHHPFIVTRTLLMRQGLSSSQRSTTHTND